MNWRAFFEATITLLVIMDPIGNAPVFVGITKRMEPRARRRAALQAIGAAALLILVFALFGTVVLEYLRVSIESLSIAGGLLLLLVALEMLRGEDFPTTGSAENVALVPLATPLLAGPGAIATVMVLMRTYPATGSRVSVLAGFAAAILVVGAVLLVAERLARAIPTSVVGFLTKVFGLLLSAIAVQLVVDGITRIVDAGV